jgi:nucleotide-binding universal stress UspA family protein
MKDMPRTSPTRPGHTGTARTGSAHAGTARTVPPHSGPVGPVRHPNPVPVLRELPSGPPGILVGLDGSDGSLWALDRAFTEAVAHDLPLYVLAAVDPAPAGYPPGMADLTEESADRLIDSMGQVALRALDAVRANHPPMPAVTVHIILGDAVDTLLKASARHGTLVVGARGNGGFQRLLLGSVATAVMHHSACPVLLVPGGTVDSDHPGGDPPHLHVTQRWRGPEDRPPPVGTEEYEQADPGSDV